MAGRPDGSRHDRGTAALSTALLVLATVVLAGLVCLAIVSWFGRLS